jgi:hypothetical protein
MQGEVERVENDSAWVGVKEYHDAPPKSESHETVISITHEK